MKLCCILVIFNLLTIICRKHHRHNGHSARRIAGGTEASIVDFPYMASLIRVFTEKEGHREQLICSAVIIDTHFALSDFTCLQRFKLKEVVNGAAVIQGNSEFWSGAPADSMIHQIVNYYPNPSDMHASTPGLGLWFANVVIIKVKTPFTGVNEKPIPLAPKDYKYIPRSEATIAGWGVTKEYPYMTSPQLRNTTVKLTDYQRCKTFMHVMFDTEVLANQMVCTFSASKCFCLYDSGGPLVQNGVLIGIGKEVDADQCKIIDYYPNGYNRISELNDWISTHMQTL